MLTIKIQQDNQDIFSITIHNHNKYLNLDFVNNLTEFIKNYENKNGRVGQKVESTSKTKR